MRILGTALNPRQWSLLAKKGRYIMQDIYELNFSLDFNILYILDTLDILPIPLKNAILISYVFYQRRIAIWNVFFQTNTFCLLLFRCLP